jgi:hypothetical protein
MVMVMLMVMVMVMVMVLFVLLLLSYTRPVHGCGAMMGCSAFRGI